MTNKSDKPYKFRRICVVDRVGDIVDNICELFDSPKSKFYNELLSEALKNKKIVESVLERLSGIRDAQAYNNALADLQKKVRFDKSSSGKKRGRKPLDRDSEGNIIRTNIKQEALDPQPIDKHQVDEENSGSKVKVAQEKSSKDNEVSHANKRVDGEISITF